MAHNAYGSVTVSKASAKPRPCSIAARWSAGGPPVVIRSTNEEQKRTWVESHRRKTSPPSRPPATLSTIAASCGPLSGTSSVGITKTGGPSGRRSNRAYSRSVSRAGNPDSIRKPASVTLLTITWSSGRVATSRTASHSVSATSAREIDPIKRVRSTGVPFSSPRSRRVNRPSWALIARAFPWGVLWTTTIRPPPPPHAPARFAASTDAAHRARRSMPVPNCSTRSGNSCRR